jgi:hypothetical protein
MRAFSPLGQELTGLQQLRQLKPIKSFLEL